jgi:branched-chain amino acid transport system substrate-binding protein
VRRGAPAAAAARAARAPIRAPRCGAGRPRRPQTPRLDYNDGDIRRGGGSMVTLSRRTFLRAAAAGVAVAGSPLPVRAQPKTFKIGTIHTVTGPLAEPGQACRLGAQMAADAVNAAGGIKALGGMKLELLLGDTQTKPDVARAEAERVINAGAQMLMGSFNSADTAAMVPVAQQRHVPFLVDISAADPITANVAKSVREGQQKVQYVYRNFPTGSGFGVRAVQYFTEIFKEANVSPKRVVLMHANDLFGTNQAKGFQAAHQAAKPGWDIVEVIPWPEPPSDLSTEVSRAKAAKPDIIAPITRPASAQLLLPELRKQRVEVMGVVGPGSPGLYEAGQLAALKDDLEYVMTSVPWPNFKNPRTLRVADDYRKRSGGKTFDTNSGYSYDGILLIADILERAKAVDADAIVDAMKKTRFTGGLMVYGGPVQFNEIGDNPNAIPAMIQILKQKPVVVWPKDAAQQKFVFPRPKA